MGSPNLNRLVLYGTLMRGERAHVDFGLHRKLAFICPCTVRGQLYDLGGYPGLVDGDGIVQGELFVFRNPGVLKSLDKFEDYNPGNTAKSLYIRTRISLLDPPGAAWVYLYNKPIRFKGRILSGQWKT